MTLLILLLGLLVLSPLFEEFFKLRLLGDLFFTAIFIYAAYSFSRSKALAAAAVSLAVPAIVLFWLKPFFNAQWVEISGGLCGMAFMVIIIISHSAPHFFAAKHKRRSHCRRHCRLSPSWP